MKFVVTGGCVLAATAIFVSVPDIAAADGGDPLKGMTYGAASAVVAKSSDTAKIVISTTVGTRLQRDDCIVTHSTRTVILSGTGTKSGVTYLINLDCNDVLASAGSPGGSLANPGSKKEKEKQNTLTYVNAHPEWCSERPENHENCVKFCTDVAPGKCTFELD